MPQRDGRWLIFHETIETDMRAGAASKAADAYFDALGYAHIASQPSRHYTRGKSLASWYHPNPRTYQTNVIIDALTDAHGCTLLEIEMRVNTFGNAPHDKDEDFWQAELDGLASTLRYGYSDPLLSYYAAERAMWYSVAVLLAVIMSVMGMAFLVMLILSAVLT